MNARKRPVVAQPLIVGAGLLALDVVIKSNSSRPLGRWAGGTCGNVLLALRYLGWRAAPVARLGADKAARRVLDDLRTWAVSTRFITITDDGSTPVVVHRIGRTGSGEPYHSFSWRCPGCGTRLPGYKPVLASAAEALVDRLETPKVFFFDRVSRGTLTLARALAKRGAAIVFEPSAVGNPILFREAWSLAHVVKYSHERLHDLPTEPELGDGVRIQIETLGREGLRYRSGAPRCGMGSWQRLEALPAETLLDAAGSGDWCTAGIIHQLFRRDAGSLNTVSDAGLRSALRYGQALAAWNCGFEGARGGMYSVDKGTFFRQIKQILTGDDHKVASQVAKQSSLSSSAICLCLHPNARPSASRTLRAAGGP